MTLIIAIIAAHLITQALTPFLFISPRNKFTRFMWDAWGNDDDPFPPDWYLTGQFEWMRLARWYLRNQLHNLCFYMIGVKGRQFKRYGRYPREIWNPHGGLNWAVIHYRWLRLPFISYRGKVIELYIGWRESGALGVAIRRAKSK